MLPTGKNIDIIIKKSDFAIFFLADLSSRVEQVDFKSDSIYGLILYQKNLL